MLTNHPDRLCHTSPPSLGKHPEVQDVKTTADLAAQHPGRSLTETQLCGHGSRAQKLVKQHCCHRPTRNTPPRPQSRTSCTCVRSTCHHHNTEPLWLSTQQGRVSQTALGPGPAQHLSWGQHPCSPLLTTSQGSPTCLLHRPGLWGTGVPDGCTGQGGPGTKILRRGPYWPPQQQELATHHST